VSKRTCCDSPMGFVPHAKGCLFIRAMASRRKRRSKFLNTSPRPYDYVPAKQP
jgi:hypothetical protein